MFSLKITSFILYYIYISFILSFVKATDCDIFQNAINVMGSAKERFGKYDDLSDCCAFDEVTCDNEKHITEISFQHFDNMYTDFPRMYKEFAKLSNLVKHELSGIMFMFSAREEVGIPKEIGLLKSLKTLILTNNFPSFHNTNIPEEIGNLTNLEYLDLSDNSLNGNIPQSFSNLTKLKTLKLEKNSIDGTIPYGFKNLINLEEMNVENNYLHGYIPLMPKLTKCNFKTFDRKSLCSLKSTTCKSDDTDYCTLEDIHNTNKENGNPNPNSDELDNEVFIEDEDDEQNVDKDISSSSSSGGSGSSGSSSSGSYNGKTKFNRSIVKFAIYIIILICSIISVIVKCAKSSKNNDDNDDNNDIQQQNTNDQSGLLTVRITDNSNNNENKINEDAITTGVVTDNDENNPYLASPVNNASSENPNDNVPPPVVPYLNGVNYAVTSSLSPNPDPNYVYYPSVTPVAFVTPVPTVVYPPPNPEYIPTAYVVPDQQVPYQPPPYTQPMTSTSQFPLSSVPGAEVSVDNNNKI